jgi:hypothetical protein
MVATRAGIVGRDAELAAIDEFLADPWAAALLLQGEPGIGKTTLLLQGIAAAESCGHRALRAQPTAIVPPSSGRLSMGRCPVTAR